MPKKRLILWTGGLDSTYLLLKTLIEEKREVYTGFVNLSNNEDAMRIEKDARNIIREDIQKIQDKKSFMGNWVYPNSDYELNYVHLYYFNDYPYAQLPFFINSIMSCIHTFDEIAMAYVYNDYNNVDMFTRRVKSIYNSYVRLLKDTTIEPTIKRQQISKCAKLIFPLIHTTKVSEIIYIYNIDSVYRTNILKNLVHCNFGFKDFNCTCPSCQNYKKAYEEAMNIINGTRLE